MNSSIEVILFDLGGVIVELAEQPFPAKWLSEKNQLVFSDWMFSQTALSFERGLISDEQFIKAMINELGINASTQSVRKQFIEWPTRVYPGIKQLLAALSVEYRLCVLSNSNELHWHRITEEFGISEFFEKMFSSHLLNMVKPEATTFEHVIKEVGVKPRGILFFGR